MPFEHQLCVGIRKIGSKVAIAAIHRWVAIGQPSRLRPSMVAAEVSMEKSRHSFYLVCAGPAVLVGPTSETNAKSILIICEALMHRSDRELYYFNY